MSDTELDLQVLESDSLQKSYCAISGLGYGSFGFAILAKSKKSVDKFFEKSADLKGTMLQPVKRRHPSKLYANGLVAIKVMKTLLAKPSDYLHVNEVNFILSVSSHENLLQIFTLFVDNINGRLNIVMEPMDQNLYQFIQRNQDRPIARWTINSILAQLLNAIRHIHSHGFFHRDVKPENILVSLASHYYGGRLMVPPDREKDLYIVKLCDYGLARHYTNTRDLTPYVSTRWYRAPEILLRLQNYSFPLDIWAYGCVAVELANRYPLFTGKNESEQLWEILKVLGHPLNHTRNDIGGKWPEGIHLADNLGFLLPFTLSSSIRDILSNPEHRELGNTIKGCFMWDPRLRPTALEMSKSDYFKGSVLTQDKNHELTFKVPGTRGSLESEFNLNCVGQDSQSETASLRNLSDEYTPKEIYSDPIMSTARDHASPLTGFEGDSYAAAFFDKYTTLGEFSAESPSLAEKLSDHLVDADHRDLALQNTSFESQEISC